MDYENVRHPAFCFHKEKCKQLLLRGKRAEKIIPENQTTHMQNLMVEME